MDALELLTYEHTNIKRGLALLRKLCNNILNCKYVDYSDFTTMIDFIRSYADKHHHAKEEVILFELMKKEMGEKAVEGPLSGMYIEHDLGRLFVRNLEAAIAKVEAGDRDARTDVIANAIGYADLLTRHIDKEDNMLYKFARRSLNASALMVLEERCNEVEITAAEKGLQEKYLKTLDELEERIFNEALDKFYCSAIINKKVKATTWRL